MDLGELMFSLCYLPTAGRLTITMIKARNLKAMDITGASGGFLLFLLRDHVFRITYEDDRESTLLIHCNALLPRYLSRSVC